MTPSYFNVLVGDDYILGNTLEKVACSLERKGLSVIRAPRSSGQRATCLADTDMVKALPLADVIAVSSRTKIDESILGSASRLRAIVFPSIGTNGITLSSANDHTILVAHGATNENKESMAEATIMIIIALLYNLFHKHQCCMGGEAPPAPQSLGATMLKGKILGLLGFGGISKEIVKRLSSWGVTIYIHTRTIPDQADPNLVFVARDVLFKKCDIVSVHLPLDIETADSIGDAEFAKMKKGAYFVNTSRGGIVDEKALYCALQSGRLSGAAIDVFKEEPLTGDHPFKRLKNVILTSHNLGHTTELFESLVPVMDENITLILKNQRPLYLRNPEIFAKWQAISRPILID
jgi:D-3-phosphoglycerate dehydrogenase